jgi:hypothetical protein
LTYWEKVVASIPEARTLMIRATLVYTDQKGAYQVPTTYAHLGLLAWFASTNVIIYQPGYEAYIVRISHLFSKTDAESAFKEVGNLVKLDRIPPNFDHKKHYNDINSAMSGMNDPGFVPMPDGLRPTWEMFGEEHLSSIRARHELLGRAEWETRRR